MKPKKAAIALPQRAASAAKKTLDVPVYGSSPTKPRRTKSEIESICRAVYEILEADNPMTVRQVFYQMVSKGIIHKTEGEYKSTVVRLLSNMRRAHELPFDWIADNTRWMRKPRTYSSLEAALLHTAQSYRRAVWDNQDDYVEVWLEKDALAGVLYTVTESWDVPLMVTRGYPSLSYLYEAAESIAAVGKPAYLYYFGDFDPSGMDITRAVERDIRQLASDAEIYFERVAVTEEQIRDWRLPTRPTKKSDSRSKSFTGESVEVDAIPSAQLRSLVEISIRQHIDPQALRTLQAAEKSERQQLAKLDILKRR